MRSRARLLATVLVLAAVALACGKKQERPPGATQPLSPAPGVAASEGPAAAPSTRPPQPDVSVTARPAAGKAPLATQPQAPPSPAASAVLPTAPAEEPAAQPAPPARPAPQQPRGKLTLPAKLGAVTFDHETHAGQRAIACASCHHPSRPQKPLASQNQACRDCHTLPAAPPMKTSLQAAFHDPKGATGTCIDCHKQKAGTAPVRCLECHKKK